MKKLLLLAVFMSAANLQAGAKACFFKHEKVAEKFAGFGPEHFACKLAAQQCHAWAHKMKEDGRLCRFDAKFDYKKSQAKKK